MNLQKECYTNIKHDINPFRNKMKNDTYSITTFLIFIHNNFAKNTESKTIAGRKESIIQRTACVDQRAVNYKKRKTSWEKAIWKSFL